MKPTGLSKDSGWMVGARRTFPISPSNTWKLVLSEEGIRAFLGDLPGFKLAKGAKYRLPDGTHGEVTTFIPGSHIRLTWQPNGYLRSSILQVRVISSGEKTTIAFHQEQLPDAAAREERDEFFRQALDRLEELIRKAS
jgi:uncharacterized protein YndB with AHSA1/START domain